jgi:predicted HTH domain antitoxin
VHRRLAPDNALCVESQLWDCNWRQGSLPVGKARELAGIDHYAFGQLLGQRGIPRHYGHEELAEDVHYARGE